MTKQFIYSIILLLIITSCEEVYYPDLDEADSLLVVEALVTNSPDKGYVKISKTTNFNAGYVNTLVNNAQVELISEEGNVYNGFLSSPGNYSFNFLPTFEQKYKLRVSISDTVYSSEFQKMPILPQSDSVYVESETKIQDLFGYDGVPFKKKEVGAQVYIDLPVNEKLNHYRFNWSSVFLYVIPAPSAMPPPPPTWGWKTMGSNGEIILTSLSRYSSANQITAFPLLFRISDYRSFLSKEQLEAFAYGNGWIVMFDFYGISDETYAFYEELKKQLNAEGKLFDPINTQIVSNIKCETHPELNVLGFFEVASYVHFRYYIYQSLNSDKVHYHKILDHYKIPNNGEITTNLHPEFWERER